MAWLATLDARSRRWLAPLRWGYLAVRYFLIALGVYLAFGLAWTEFRAGRVGLGVGLSTALIFAVVRGMFIALERRSSGGPPPRV